MKKITAFIISLVLFPVIWGEEITPVSAQASCQATVDVVIRDIKRKGVGANFIVNVNNPYDEWNYNDHNLRNSRRVDMIDITVNPKFTQGRPLYIADNIIESKLLLKSYANRIFSSCLGTGYVIIGKYEPTESVVGYNYEAFGITDDSILGFKVCADSSSELINTISEVERVEYPEYGYCAYVIPDF